MSLSPSTGLISQPSHRWPQVRYHRGEGYLEVDVDIASSMMAAGLWRAVENVCRTLIIDLAFVIEAQEEHELPERLMASVRFHKLDLNQIRRRY